MERRRNGTFGPDAPATPYAMLLRVEIDRNGLEILDRDECFRLLATAKLGRLAVTLASLPTVFPVNFHFDGEQILVLTGRGTKLDAALQNAVVAFEVDDISPIDHEGWSVVVTGRAREVDDLDELEAVRVAPLARWAPRGGQRVIAISTELVSGRRLVHALDGAAHPAGFDGAYA